MPGDPRHARAATVGAIAVLLAMAVPAVAAAPGSQRPRNVTPPTFSGDLKQGELLTAMRGTWTGTQPLSFRYRWRVCEATTCRGIPFATKPAYRLTDSDVRKRIQLSVSADGPGGTATALTDISDLVAPDRIRRTRARVTISGDVTRRGARLSRVRVRAERDTTIEVRCKGRGCPFRRLSTEPPKGGLLRVRRLQRNLRAGIAIGLRVTKPFQIGKYTRVHILHGRLPKRLDRCIEPGRSRPSRCPR